MASAYGIVHQYGEPQSNFDTEFAAGVLQNRQNKFDTNQVKVEQTLAQLGLSTSMLERDEDREYMYDKVSNLINNIPSLKDTDYSSNQSTREITSRINEALDDRVIKQLGESKKIRDYKATAQAIQEENPDKYSQVNYMDGLKSSKYESYMRGETDSVGSLSYTPYVDVNRQMLERIKEAKEVIGEQEIDVKDEKGNLVKKTTSNLTISEWASYLPNLISPEIEAQMRVEARASYEWDNQLAAQDAHNAINESVKGYEKEINKLDNILSTRSLNKAQRDKLNKDKKRFQSLKQSTIENFDPNNITAESIALPKIMNQLIYDNAALIGSDPSMTFLDPKKHASKAITEKDRLDSIGIGPSSSALATNTPDITNETFEARREESQTKLTGWTNRGTEYVKQKSPDLDLDKEVNTLKEQGFTEEQAKVKIVSDVYRKEGELAKADEGARYLEDLRKENLVKEKTHDTFVSGDIWVNQAEKFFKSGYEEGAFDRQKIVNEKGQEVSSREYLKDQGVTNVGQFKKFVKDPEASAEYKSQIYGDILLNETETNLLANQTNLAYALTKNEGKLSRISKEMLHNFDRLARSKGTDAEFTDVFKVVQGRSSVGEKISRMPNSELMREVTGGSQNIDRELTPAEVRQIAKDPKFVSDLKITLREDADPKIAEVINKRMKYAEKASGTTTVTGIVNMVQTGLGRLAGDSNFYDDFTIRNTLGFQSKEYQENYNKALKDGMLEVKTPRKITINAAASAKDENKPAIVEMKNVVQDLVTEGSFLYDPKNPSTISVDPTNPDNLIISQLYQEEKPDYKNNKRESVSEYKTATVNKSQFMQIAPTLAAEIDLESAKGGVEIVAEQNREEFNLSYPDGKDEELMGKYLNYLQNPQVVNMAMKPKEVIKRRFPELYDQDAGFGIVFDNAIENSEKFKVGLKTTEDGRTYAKVSLNTGTDNEPSYEMISNVDLSDRDEREVMSVFNTAPQVYITQALERVALDFRMNNYELSSESDKFSILYDTFVENLEQ